MKKIILCFVIISLFIGCTSQEKPPTKPPLVKEEPEPSEEEVQAPEKPSLTERILVHVNAKDGFWGGVNKIPEIEGYEVYAVGYGVPLTVEGGGLALNYFLRSRYISDEDDFNLEIWKPKLSFLPMTKMEFSKLEERQVDGNTVYSEFEDNTQKLVWIDGNLIYKVSREGVADLDELAKYAKLVLDSTEKIDLTKEENEYLALYQYLPDPLEGQSLGTIFIAKMPMKFFFGDYVKEDVVGEGKEFRISIAPGDTGIMVGYDDIEKLRDIKRIQVDNKTAKAGYREGKYKIIYMDLVEKIAIAVETNEENEALNKESMKEMLIKAMQESGVY